MKARLSTGIAALLLLGATLVFPGGAPAAGGALWGTVGLEMKNGNYVPGENVKVLLVRSAIELEVTEDLAALPKIARRDRLTAYHMRFFVLVRGQLADPAYRVADTLSSDVGTYGFTGVPTGSYYLVVTFPTLINGYKAAWQAPVEVRDNRLTYAPLNNDNLFLPASSRSD